jgi:hypothetical protein
MKACVDGSTFCGWQCLGRVTVRSLKIDAERSYETALMADRKVCSPRQSCEWNACHCICDNMVWSLNSFRTTVYSSIVSKLFHSHIYVSTLRRVAYEVARTSQFFVAQFARFPMTSLPEETSLSRTVNHFETIFYGEISCALDRRSHHFMIFGHHSCVE